MSKEEITVPTCKQRFKGIENFLKRIAFNLGNTPSQTEVKIISCIPIDVTDLQQKIIHLEKQLDEAKGTRGEGGEGCFPSPPQSPTDKQASKQNKLCPIKKTNVNTAILEPRYPPLMSTAAISCKSLDCDQSTSPVCSQPKKKSNVSFIFPALSIENQYNIDTYEDDNTSMVFEPQPTMENRRYFFRKKKKLLKNKKERTPYVYYAETNSMSPFNRSELTEEAPNKENDMMSRSYLAKMINKQYKPKLLGDNLSMISQFSSPVCRDDQPQCERCYYESDICSCCHGQFHNIDDNISKFNNPQTYMVNEMNTGSAYYDTNQYDLVPVKENPVKVKKDLDIPRKKEPKPGIDMKCWPENVRTKPRYNSLYVPPMIKYYVTRAGDDYISRDRLEYYAKKIPVKANKIEIAKKVAKRRKEVYKRDRSINIESSKSCSIDFGTVYPKKVYKKPKIHESLQPIPVQKKNVECLTTVINNSECQTGTNNLDEANLSDAKTEATLNQIKSILQSVLAEVKVSSQTKSEIVEEKPKKDAVVQKGASQSNMPSSLMNSITYSPYAMPHQFIASCSRQLNQGQFCYPQSAMKCFQNFPLFIQPQGGRQLCATCYQNSSHAKPVYIKQAATTATNTDSMVKEERSKETEKLIKEIYKSMALTMNVPNRDTSLSEYDEIMKSMTGFKMPIDVKAEPKKPPKKIKNDVQAVSEFFMKKDMIDTSETPTINTTFESKLPSNETSTQSHLVTTDTELRLKKDRLEKYYRNKQAAAADAEKRSYHEQMTHIATTITESGSSSSETESDTTLIRTKEGQKPKQKTEKQGLFSKMFKSVKLFKPKDKAKMKDEKTESENETSDSDDYQTIYSQKIEKSMKHKNRTHNLPKRKTHSKISYKQTYQRDKSPEKRRSPYMEQEYRRYWNERLMFHDNKPKYSSERVYSNQTTPQKSAYYQTYEARNALVKPKITSVRKPEPRIDRISREYDNEIKDPKLPAKGLAWLKKNKMGIHCGEQWKKLLLEG